jgi:hypothetical protein
MTNANSISPAKYWRETRDWPKLIGQSGVIIAATRVQYGLPELSASSPYWILLVKSNDPKSPSPIHLYIGADGYNYKERDRVQCVIRRLSSPGNGLIHYGIKVLPAKT